MSCCSILHPHVPTTFVLLLISLFILFLTDRLGEQGLISGSAITSNNDIDFLYPVLFMAPARRRMSEDVNGEW